MSDLTSASLVIIATVIVVIVAIYLKKHEE